MAPPGALLMTFRDWLGVAAVVCFIVVAAVFCGGTLWAIILARRAGMFRSWNARRTAVQERLSREALENRHP